MSDERLEIIEMYCVRDAALIAEEPAFDINQYLRRMVLKLYGQNLNNRAIISLEKYNQLNDLCNQDANEETIRSFYELLTIEELAWIGY